MKDGTKGFDGRLEQESSGAGELLEVGELLVAGEAGSVSCGVVPGTLRGGGAPPHLLVPGHGDS